MRKTAKILRIVGTVIAFAALVVGICTEIEWQDTQTVIERLGLSASAVVIFCVFAVVLLRDKIKAFAERHAWAKMPKSPLFGMIVALIVLGALQAVIDPMVKITLFTTCGTAVDVVLQKVADILDASAALKSGEVKADG